MICSCNLDYGETFQLMFFTQVQNVAEIVEKVAQTSSYFVNCTIINSELILDPFQILVAANKAVVAKFTNSLITKNLCTELLFNLSLSDNITESLQKFGYGSNTNNLLLAIFGNNIEQETHVISEVRGCLEPTSLLGEKCNLNLIRKTYDVTKEQELTSSLLDLIVTKIACKSV